MSKKENTSNQPIIETIINTCALALTAFGVTEVQKGFWKGYVAIAFGMTLEFCKYLGRSKKLW